jgi:hypothetical protein
MAWCGNLQDKKHNLRQVSHCKCCLRIVLIIQRGVREVGGGRGEREGGKERGRVREGKRGRVKEEKETERVRVD